MSQVVGHFGALREGKSSVTSSWVHGRRVVGPVLVRFHGVDGAAHEGESPYAFMQNDMVNRAEADGNTSYPCRNTSPAVVESFGGFYNLSDRDMYVSMAGGNATFALYLNYVANSSGGGLGPFFAGSALLSKRDWASKGRDWWADFPKHKVGRTFKSARKMANYIKNKGAVSGLINAGDGSFLDTKTTGRHKFEGSGDQIKIIDTDMKIEISGGGYKNTTVDVKSELFSSHLSNGRFSSEGIANKFTTALAVYKQIGFTDGLNTVAGLNSTGGYSIAYGLASNWNPATRTITWNSDYSSVQEWVVGGAEYTASVSPLGQLAHELGHAEHTLARYRGGPNSLYLSARLAMRYENFVESALGRPSTLDRPHDYLMPVNMSQYRKFYINASLIGASIP